MNGATDFPLLPQGVAQAQALAKRLAKEPIRAIYASDMQRAQQTARIIARYHPGVPLHIETRLREREFGVFEGKPFKELEAAMSESSIVHFRPEAGESVADVQQRLIPVLNELHAQHPRQTVLLVTHGTLIRAALLHLLGLPQERESEVRHGNTGFSILEFDETRKPTAAVINDTAHLDTV
jgi:broad specificity phosphatase PhoE